MSNNSRPEKVVVIGGGVAGLSAAAWLALDERLEVELVEQHCRLGGACSSFFRDGFTFDAGAHAIGSCHRGGAMHTMLSELEVWDRLEMLRADPMDTVVTPDYRLRFWAAEERLHDELRSVFPSETDRLIRLLRFLAGFGPADFGRWAEASFRDVLDHHLGDDRAKTAFMAPLGNIGLPASRLGAITGCSLWRDNQLAGGWAPRGGFQKLADALARRIGDLGGRVSTGIEASRIEIEGGTVRAVHVRPTGGVGDGSVRRIPCRRVVAAGAARHIYLDLVGREALPADFVQRLENLEPSFSGGIVYLGLAGGIDHDGDLQGCHWYLDEASPQRAESMLSPSWIAEHLFDEIGPLCAVLPTGHDPGLAPDGKDVAVVIVPAVWRTGDEWDRDAERLASTGVARLEQLLPGIRDRVELRTTATPASIERYTRNTRGAWYGWAVSPEQSNLRRLDRTGPVGGLYLAGQWTRPGPGVVNAMRSGQLTAKAIRRDLGR